MKKSLLCLILSCTLFVGCEAFTKAFSPSNEPVRTKWDGTDYERSVGVGTGVDPQAREIESRLGYKNNGF